MRLNQDLIQRMFDGRGGAAGGGSSLDPGMIAGLATEAWTEENYVSKTFFNELFVIHKKTTTTVYDGTTVVSTTVDTSGTFAPNEIPSEEESTDSETGYRTVVVTEVDNIEAKKGLWTDFFLSALGLNGSGGGGGIGDVTWQALGDNTDTRQIASSHLTSALGSALAGYATQSWVTSQNYVTSSAISDMATKTWVNNQSFVNWTALGDTTTTQQIALSHLTTALSGYATQTWVTNNFSTPSSVATQMQTYAKIQNGTITIGDTSLTPITSVTGTFWGKSFTNGGTISGTISAGNNGGAIEKFHSIELNSAGTLSNYGGFIDFHFYDSNESFVSTADYTTRIIESAVGVISILAKNNDATNASRLAGLVVGASYDGSYVQIGNVRLVYDSNNNALKVVGSNGTSSANFYATGSVSALGYGAGGGGGTGDVTWDLLADNTDTRPIALSHISTTLQGYLPTVLAGYVTITGNETITGLKTMSHGLVVQGRVSGTGDDEGIVIRRATNDYAGLTLGEPNGTRSVFYLTSSNTAIWRFSIQGTGTFNISHPQKDGTIAVVSDIPTNNNQLTNGAGYITSSGTSAYAKSLKYRSTVTSTDGIDSNHFTSELNVFTFTNVSIPILSSNGIIIDVGWENTNYGAQFVVDDDPTYIFGLRQRIGNGWSDWKRIPMGDGTGASGTWGISITGNAATATSATTATNLANNPSLQAGTTNANAVTVTAGGKTSSEFTIPYATRAIKFYTGDSASTGGCIGSEIGAHMYRYTAIDTSDAPVGGDGFILGLNWDSNARYGAQLYIDADPTYNISLRQRNNEGWQAWKAIITENNIGSQSVSYATSAGNADTLDGYHASYGSDTPWGTIPVIHAGGYMDIGSQIEFHSDNSGGVDFSTRLYCSGNNSNSVALPTSSGTLALTSQFGDYVTLATAQTISGAKTMTSILTVKAPIFGYNYNAAGANAAAFILDKPGSNYTGIGAHTSNDVIWFGACNGSGAWIDTYKQIWDFNGTIRQEGNNVIHAGNIASQTVASCTGNAGSATKLQTARTIWQQSFDGTGNVNGSIYLDNDTPHYFRDPSTAGWRGGIYWGTSGTEAMSFVAANANTKFLFVNGSDIASWSSSTHTTVTPLMSIGTNVGIGVLSPSTKLHVNGTATINGNVVSGTAGGAIEGFQSWELNTHNTAGTNIGGFLDFHYNGTAQDYSLRLIEKDYSGVLQIMAKDTGTGNAQRAGLIVGAGTYTSFVQIGNGRIVWDDTNHALRIVDADGNACNLYATGGISALGYQSGGGGGGSTGVFSTSITPDTTGVYDLGTSTYKWRNLHLAGANGGNGFSIITSYSSYVYIGSLNKILFGADVEFEDTAYVENRMGIGVKNGNYDLYVYGENEGNAYFAGDVSVASLTNRSDMRLKDVVGDVNLSVQQIASAPTFKFRFKEKAKRTMVGTSAQYWDAVLPESVTRDADGILGLDYGVTALVSTIILAKGMTEHERRITKLEMENAELRARIKDLEEN